MLGEGLKTVGAECFYASGLEEVVVPRTVREIGNSMFQSCAALRMVSFTGDTLERIGESAFLCSGIEEFVAPPSLREVGYMAFSDCRALRRADLGACILADGGRNFLASRAFENSGLESVVLPSALRVIGERRSPAART